MVVPEANAKLGSKPDRQGGHKRRRRAPDGGYNPWASTTNIHSYSFDYVGETEMDSYMLSQRREFEPNVGK